MGNCLVTKFSSSNLVIDYNSSSPPPPPSSSSSLHEHILPFPTHSRLEDRYDLGPELGRGHFGIIRTCTSRSDPASVFACKSISKPSLSSFDSDHIANIVQEVRIMAHISSHVNVIIPNPNPNPNPSPRPTSHCNIVQLHDVFEDREFVHLVIDLCRGGDLFDRIAKKKCYPEKHAASLMKSLLETVQFCHGLGVMHRDLKPENILLVDESDSSPIKLADFGLAVQFKPGQKFSDMVGSSYYIAPEVFQGEYSECIDVWSSGVILYVLLCGFPPFGGPTQQAIFNSIQRGKLNFPPHLWDKISPSAKDLISNMLCPEPNSRFTVAQALNHPWIVQHTSQPQALR